METKRLTIAFLVMFFLLAIGAVFFHYVEQWSWVDAFYFTGITITTIGYGDLHPTKTISKIFVVFFALFAIGLFLYYISIIADSFIHHLKIEEHLARVIEGEIQVLEQKKEHSKDTLQTIKKKEEG